MNNQRDETGWLLQPQMIRAALPLLDVVVCGALGVVFWAYFGEASALPKPLNPIDIGAGGFPKILAVATLVGLLALVVSAAVRAMDSVPVMWVSIRRPLNVLATVISLSIEAIYFEDIGVLISVWVFAFITTLACGERRLKHLVGVPAALAAFIYVTFVLALRVNLP